MIDTANLSRTFPGRARAALDHVTLHVGAGEIVALAGRNGAGKTTLLDVLSTLLLPSSGHARVAGCDVARDAQGARRALGYAMAGPRALHLRLTGRRNLEFFAALHPDIARPRDRVAEVAALLGLEPFIDREVRTCSEGMLQMLVIARAILGRPRVLLLDEPMRGLDRVAQRHLSSVMQKLIADGALGAVLYATHEIGAQPPSRLLVLSEGRVIHDGPVPPQGLDAFFDPEPAA